MLCGGKEGRSSPVNEEPSESIARKQRESISVEREAGTTRQSSKETKHFQLHLWFSGTSFTGFQQGSDPVRYMP